MTEAWTDRSELRYWLALVRLPGVGPVTAHALLQQWNTPRHLFEAATADHRRLQSLPDTAKAYLHQPDWTSVDQDLAWLEHPGHHAITLQDAAYPPLLKQIHDAPMVLFMLGDPALLSTQQLAIVGSRNPSASGERNAIEFARHLSEAGLTVTSGMAVGIDAAAHRGALLASGHTIAVAGTGLDRVYPARHRELALEIAARGAVVSEFPPGTPPRPEHFPRRNRIISGMSLGTLVVEAAARSGSLITARMAADQGREVFAIPGSIHNPLSRGCHLLIRQGAKLVESVQDIFEEFGAFTARNETTPVPVKATSPDPQPLEFQTLLRHIGDEPTAVDTLVERSGLTAEQVCSMLVVLELHGQIASAPGGLYSKIH